MFAHVITLSRLLWGAGFAAATACWCARALTGGEALVLAALAAMCELSDALDGPVARWQGTAGVLGGILDPLADSLCRLTIYFSLALAGWVTLAVPLVMTVRDILTAYTRVVGALTGGSTSARTSGKFKAIIQGSGIFVLLFLAWAAKEISPNTLAWSRWGAAAVIMAVTVWSGVDYLRGAARGIRALRSSPTSGGGTCG